MAGYCLKNGRIQEAWGEDAAGRELAAVFHLTADGEMKELHEFPALSEGEGALAYAGEFYIEPLEVQIEFLKAANAEKMAGGAALAACRPGAAGIGGTLCHS